ncbi:MAG TPA: response regulator [Stellaceae bacterium]|nr:response regulator [Stellaceae bacterium]
MRDVAVFLVDDDDAVRDSLKLLFETYGLAVSDFASALQFLRYGALPCNACLVLDVHMPHISGLDLVEKLAAEGALPPTVMISGRAEGETIKRAAAAGVFGFLYKPFDSAKLVTMVRQAAMSGSPIPAG